jgi:glycosyltransferase involved in cell wall biosynthesis
MEPFLYWSGLAIFLASAAKALEGLYAVRQIPVLSRVVPADVQLSNPPPKLSVIVAARNEAQTIEGAVRSLFRQDYPNLELILVNDRSTDGTGAVMDRLAREFPGIRVVHIETLPEGWLGKNHALYTGSRHATGDWLLFTDADVHYDPTTLRRAVAFAKMLRLDHLTLAPDLVAHGYWLESWVAFFLQAFLSYQTPYKANNPKSKVGMGIGAFNLVRRQTYEAIGTHRAISLRPDDDLRLGQRIKRMGFRQNIAIGTDLLHVEWYRSLPEAIRGLEKNMVAGMEYNLAAIIAAMVGVFGIMVWPFLAVWIAHGPARWLYLAAIAAQMLLYLTSNTLRRGRTLLLMPSYPVAALLFMYTVIRSTYLTYRRGGIFWRETFYPLHQLRSQRGLPD